MDPFTQRMLEKAEQRSRTLGISNASKFPLADCIGAGGDAGASVTAAAPLASQENQQKQQQTHKMQFHQMQQQQQQPFSKSSTNSSNSNSTKLQLVEKMPVESPNKVLRQFSSVDKENCIEINIMTDKDVEVQVQVEEQEITDNETENQQINKAVNQPLAKLRDTSRNQLQRLGALYSNTDDLSSPIHRTENDFYAQTPDAKASARKPKQRYGKLVDLANSISQWEDDTAHHNTHANNAVPPPKPDLPSRRLMQHEAENRNAATEMTAVIEKTSSKRNEEFKGTSDESNNKTKQLKWDPKVINSLEAQGFQRRDSSTVKYSYDYGKRAAYDDNEHYGEEEEEEDDDIATETTKMLPDTEKRTVSKLATVYTVTKPDDKKPAVPGNKPKSVKSNLVAGRAAVFEQKVVTAQPAQRAQKDPTELSLKERMQLFERNKGEAPMPKAAFGISPSINQIRQDSAGRKEDAKAPSNVINTTVVKSNADPKLRDKVAALVTSATTISENRIKADIHKQRQEDMQILANRFNKQREIYTNEQEQQHSQQQGQGQPKSQEQQQQQQQTNVYESQITTKQTVTKTNFIAARKSRPPPPPPPPLPPKASTTVTANQELNLSSTKRRSPGDTVDSDDVKRVKKASTTTTAATANAQRLYPALSDLESNDSDNDNYCTTATVSAQNTGDEMALEREHRHAANNIVPQDDEIDSYTMESADDDDDDEKSNAGNVGNGSLGREIMHVVKKQDSKQQQQQQKHAQLQQQQQQQKQKQKKQIKVRYADRDYHYGGGNGGDTSLDSSEASIGMDDYLDEALEDGDDDSTQESGEEENGSRTSRRSKDTTTSNSFSFRKTPAKYTSCQTISEEDTNNSLHTPLSGNCGNAAGFAQPVTSELSINNGNENMVTLVHTVSFYRKQQHANSATSTPIRKICREQQVMRAAGGEDAKASLNFELSPRQHESTGSTGNYLDANENMDAEESETEDDSYKVQEKIQKLLDEVCKQQQVMAQTSQALNLCAATIEFSGSAESVEGERHLLVASHRRQACLDEVQRLRVEKSLRPIGAPKEKGRLTVKEITLPLRQEYIRKLASDTISGHHLVCLLKYNEHVLATKTVPTLPGLLAVKFPDVLQLNNVYADFRITLEIYGMTAHREELPHELKYHINLKKSGIKTPKKKGSENRLVMPPVQSPAGPHVVRKPALVQYGFAIFSLREIQRTTWSLTEILGITPLDGIVHMKVNCELSVSVEYKGFLTMFEDISGFGAWHRRWCHLNGTILNYWKYPDDEKKKTPMGTIDLYTCSSQKVTTAPRDICARLNTMLLECQRPAKDGDQESLIVVPNGRVTTVRHLLSADTKEEREEWCAYFNKALTLLRAWGPPQ